MAEVEEAQRQLAEVVPDWLEAPDDGPDDGGDDISIDEYDLTATPNDFNVKTIVDFINQGVFLIPSFQRNYVWDIKRASKLIESLIIGLPVPQIFLYEEQRNQFLVVDGQQRLMSIYYFVRKRFPYYEKRPALRRVFDDRGQVPAELLADDDYFSNFNLVLPARLPGKSNPLHKLNYDTLGEFKTTLDLRTIRCVVIKQNSPKNDDSSVYEIFNRLNTGGVNLTPQEIRTSLYHSEFYKMLYKLNVDHRWRSLLGSADPDLRMRDVEILLRGFAMLMRGDQYKPSMTRFLNQFSKEMRTLKPADLEKLRTVFDAFLTACAGLPPGTFGTRQRRINVSVFEAVVGAYCGSLWNERPPPAQLDEERIIRLKADPEFMDAAGRGSADKTKVALRLKKAREYLL